MPPTTRSRGLAELAAPLNGKAQPAARGISKAATSRTYHSSPALKQLHFPPRQKTVKLKTYGKAAAAPTKLAKQDARQSTMTQFYDHGQPLDGGLHDDEESGATVAPRPKKRRKTEHDMPDLKPSSSFYTQTLTQMHRSRSLGGLEDEQDMFLPGNGEDGGLEEDAGLENRGEESAVLIEQQDNRADFRLEKEVGECYAKTKTPCNRRRFRDEVPNSQPTPCTPFTPFDTTPMASRFGQYAPKSPLEGRSTNLDAPPPTLETLSAKYPRTRVIQDSYSTDAGSTIMSSPLKLAERGGDSPRRPLAEIDVGHLMSQDLGEIIRSTPPRLALSTGRGCEEIIARTPSFVEIPDSEMDEDEVRSLSPSPQGNGRSPTKLLAIPDSLAGSPTESPSKRRGGRPSTGSGHGPTESETAAETPIPARTVDLFEDGPSSEDIQLPTLPVPEEVDKLVDDEGLLSGSPVRLPDQRQRRVQIQEPPKKPSPSRPRHTQARSQLYSQGLESQRVPLDVIRSFAPQTDRSDVAVAMNSGVVDRIVSGQRRFAFRAKALPPDTCRIWIYVMSPVCELRYMATIGPAEKPGQIDSEGGDGNADFNNGKSGKFAYELLQVYQLNDPVPLKRLKEEGWLKSPPNPMNHSRLLPVVASRLISNLRCQLFDDDNGLEEEEEDDALPGSQGRWPEMDDDEPGTSQLVSDQLRDDVLHSAHGLSSTTDDDIVIPASHEAPGRGLTGSSTTPDDPFARPALPARLSQTRTLNRRQQSQRESQVPTQSQSQRLPLLSGGNLATVRPSQATTASGPSSPALLREVRPIQTISLLSSQDNSGPSLPSLSLMEMDGEGHQTPIRRPRTQVLRTVSSLPDAALQDSLLDELVRPPAVEAWDSE